MTVSVTPKKNQQQQEKMLQDLCVCVWHSNGLWGKMIYSIFCDKLESLRCISKLFCEVAKVREVRAFLSQKILF